jgi:hypothetical protein
VQRTVRLDLDLLKFAIAATTLNAKSRSVYLTQFLLSAPVSYPRRDAEHYVDRKKAYGGHRQPETLGRF